MVSETRDRPPDGSPSCQYKSWPAKNFVNCSTKKTQHHRLRSLRSESKSFSFLKQVHGVKQSIKEAGDGGGVAALAR
jgi:hypothetical protein